jgi:hypothetical protein
MALTNFDGSPLPPLDAAHSPAWLAARALLLAPETDRGNTLSADLATETNAARSNPLAGWEPQNRPAPLAPRGSFGWC